VGELKTGSNRLPKSSAKRKEAFVACQLIVGEQPAEQAYRYLEIFDVNIAIE